MIVTPDTIPPESRRTWLLDERRQLAAHQALCAARETRWSWARLVVFALALVPWLVIPQHAAFAGGLTLTALVLFALTIRGHHTLLAQREHADRLLRVVDEALQRVGGAVVCVRDWQRPPDAPEDDALLPNLLQRGPTWALTPQERDDLDLFAAPVGIYGLLNRTSTAPGARRLRDMLENPLLDPQRIRRRQSAVQWLAHNAADRLHIMAGCAALRGEDRRLARLMHALADAQPLKLPLPAWLLVSWAMLSAAFAIFVIARIVAADFTWVRWLLLLLAVNGALYARLRGRLNAAFAPWQDAAWAARALLTAARCAARHLPAVTNRSGVADCCGAEHQGAAEPSELAVLAEHCNAIIQPGALPTLYRRSGWVEGGGLPRLLANILVFADVFLARRLLACALPHRGALLAGISAIAELEALCSFAAFAWEQPVACYPAMVAGTKLQMVEGVHPLVPPERVVPNDASLDENVRLWIITGSNMAGKSTFLRTVALNTLLAQAGGIATARELTLSPVRLITDLRTRDSLAERESYFLAEVRHVRRMVLPPAGDAPVLGIMDEPFRGTDSQDQTAASLAVVQQLLASPHLFLVATHNRQLTTLAEDGQTATTAPNGRAARNFHFRENLAGDELVFDYRLYPGPAQTRNALRILAREGYPPELVERAQAWLQNATGRQGAI